MAITAARFSRPVAANAPAKDIVTSEGMGIHADSQMARTISATYPHDEMKCSTG
jgi:hypothetical protein